MKKSTYFIQTNEGIKTFNDSMEKHGSIIIHRPMTSEKYWVISACGFKITTAKKIHEARKYAKFLMVFSYVDEKSENYYKKHEEVIKNFIRSSQ